MGEILFGLIMTLTFTLGAGIIIEEEGREGARQLLIATIGCNIAWGLIDGVLYVLGQLFERGRLRRVAQAVTLAGSPADARQLLAMEFDEALEPVTDPPLRTALYDSMAERLRTTPLADNSVRRADLLGGLISGWLVFACSVPAAIPFLLFNDPHFALRVSNAILLGALFLAGYRSARYTLASPWLTGACFVVMGLVLVVIAIALGG
jgi:VIT1/CCC1 family predicted Fe2+/Mn2+ transporter